MPMSLATLSFFPSGFRELHQDKLFCRSVRVKGELKDALVYQIPYHNDRIDKLITDYHLNPGRFYRETPFQGILCFRDRNGNPEYCGSSRIKRVRRLAEKSARRIIDRIFVTIKRHAESMADERARLLGVPRERLLTAPEDIDGGVSSCGETPARSSARKKADCGCGRKTRHQ